MGNVKVFRSSDYGAPVLFGNAGYLIPVLDACLVTGYGELTISSITHSNGVVTVVTSTAHNLGPYGRQTISGITNDTAYNGDVIIQPVDGFTFTYSKGGITQATGTGATMRTKSTSVGWTKDYSGTNLAAYRQAGGNRHYLRVDDTTTLSVRVVGYETMSGISTGTGLFPTAAQFSGGLYMQKSQTADATNPRDWILVADDETFYLHVNWNSYLNNTMDSPVLAFGNIQSDRPGDAFHTIIVANVSAAIAGFRFSYLANNVQTADTGSYLARSYTQIGSSTPSARISDTSKSNSQSNMGASQGLPYPHPVNGGLYMTPVWVTESLSPLANSVIRGTLKGIWNPLHNRPLAHSDIFLGNGVLSGKVFMAWNVQLNGQVMIDISPTW